jgi:hypothetical protein
MSLTVVLALGSSLLGSLAFLAHTIYRRPVVAAPTPQRRRFPIESPTGALVPQEHLVPNAVGEVDAAYTAWIENLGGSVSDPAPASPALSASSR